MEYREIVKRKISKEILSIILACTIPASMIMYTIYDLQNPPASELAELCIFETVNDVSHKHDTIDSILHCNKVESNRSVAWFILDC